MNHDIRDELLIRVDERTKSTHELLKTHLLDHKVFKSKLLWLAICPLVVGILIVIIAGCMAVK